MLTSTDPHGYERMASEGLELAYVECASVAWLREAITRYDAYRRANVRGLLKHAWVALGGLIEGDDYLRYFQRILREPELFRDALLADFEKSVDLSWSRFSVPITDEEDLARHRCGVASVKLWYDEGAVQGISDAWLTYNIGSWWFDNRDIAHIIEAEMQRLVDESRVAPESVLIE